MEKYFLSYGRILTLILSHVCLSKTVCLIFYLSKKESGCQAKLTGKKNSDGTFTYTRNKHEHTHIIDIRDVEVKKRVKAAKEKAVISSKSARELYAEAVAGVSAEVIGQMPSQEAFAKQIRSQRKG